MKRQNKIAEDKQISKTTIFYTYILKQNQHIRRVVNVLKTFSCT